MVDETINENEETQNAQTSWALDVWAETLANPASNPEFMNAARAAYLEQNGVSWDDQIDARVAQLQERIENSAGHTRRTAQQSLDAIDREGDLAQWASDNTLAQTPEFLAAAEADYNAIHGEGAWQAYIDQTRAELEEDAAGWDLFGRAEQRLEDFNPDQLLADWGRGHILSQQSAMDWSNAAAFGLDGEIFRRLDSQNPIADETMHDLDSDFGRAWLNASEILYNEKNGENAWAERVAERGWDEQRAAEELAGEGEAYVSWFENNLVSAGRGMLDLSDQGQVAMVYLMSLNGYTESTWGDFGGALWRSAADPTFVAATAAGAFTLGTGAAAGHGARIAGQQAILAGVRNIMISKTVQAAAVRGAVGASAEGAISEAALELSAQNLAVENDIRSDYDLSAAGQRATFGAIFGAALGGTLSGGGRFIANNIDLSALASRARTFTGNGQEAPTDAFSDIQRLMNEAVETQDAARLAEIGENIDNIRQNGDLSDAERAFLNTELSQATPNANTAPVRSEAPEPLQAPDAPRAPDVDTNNPTPVRGPDAEATRAPEAPEPINPVDSDTITPQVDTPPARADNPAPLQAEEIRAEQAIRPEDITPPRAPEIDPEIARAPDELETPAVPDALEGVTMRGEDAAPVPAANAPRAPSQPDLPSNPIPVQPGNASPVLPNIGDFNARLAAAPGPLDGYTPRGPLRSPAGEGSPGGPSRTPPALPEAPAVPENFIREHRTYADRVKYIQDNIENPAEQAAFLIELDRLGHTTNGDQFLSRGLLSQEARNLYAANRVRPDMPAAPSAGTRPDVDTNPPPQPQAVTLPDFENMSEAEIRTAMRGLSPEQRSLLRQQEEDIAATQEALARQRGRPEQPAQPTRDSAPIPDAEPSARTEAEAEVEVEAEAEAEVEAARAVGQKTPSNTSENPEADQNVTAERVRGVSGYFQSVREERALRREMREIQRDSSRVRAWENEIEKGTKADGSLDANARIAQDKLNSFYDNSAIGHGPEPNLINLRRYDQKFEGNLENKNKISKSELRESKSDLDTASELAAREVNAAIKRRGAEYDALPNKAAKADYLRNLIKEHINSFPQDERHGAWRDLIVREHTILEVVSGLANGKHWDKSPNRAQTLEAQEILKDTYAPLIENNQIPFLQDTARRETTHMSRLGAVARKMSEMTGRYGTGSMGWRESSDALGRIFDTFEYQDTLRRQLKSQGKSTEEIDKIVQEKTTGKVEDAFIVLINSGASPEEIFWWARSARIKGLRPWLRDAIARAPDGISKAVEGDPVLYEILFQAVSNNPVSGFPADPHRIKWSKELLLKTLDPSRPEFAWAAQRVRDNFLGIKPAVFGGSGKMEFLPSGDAFGGFFNPWNWGNTAPVRLAKFLSYNNPIMGGHWIHNYPRGFESNLISKPLSMLFGASLAGLTLGATIDRAPDGEYDNPLSYLGAIQSEIAVHSWAIPLAFPDIVYTNIGKNVAEGFEQATGLGDGEYNFVFDLNGVDAVSTHMIDSPEFRAEHFPGIFGESETPPPPTIIETPSGLLITGENQAGDPPPAPAQNGAGDADTDTDADTDIAAAAANGADNGGDGAAGTGAPDDDAPANTDIATNTNDGDTQTAAALPPRGNGSNQVAAARRNAAAYSTEEAIQAILPGGVGESLTSTASQIELRRIWNTAKGWFGDLGAIAGGMWKAMGDLPGPWGGIAQIATAFIGGKIGLNMMMGTWNMFTSGKNWGKFAMTAGLGIGALHVFNYFSEDRGDRLRTITNSDYRSEDRGLNSETIQRYDTSTAPIAPTRNAGVAQFNDEANLHIRAGAEFETAQNITRGLSEHAMLYAHREAAAGVTPTTVQADLDAEFGEIAVVNDMHATRHDGTPMVLTAVETRNPFTGRTETSWTAAGELAREGQSQAAEAGLGFVAAQEGGNFQNVAPIVGATYALAALDEDGKACGSRFVCAGLERGDNAIHFDRAPHTDALAAIGWGETGTAATGTGRLTPAAEQEVSSGPVNFADLAGESDQPTII